MSNLYCYTKSIHKTDNDSFETCLSLLKEKKYNSLYDFDNHLDDLKFDWRNLEINKWTSTDKVETLTSNKNN